MTPGEFRWRVAYEKAGRLRYLSHLEVVHALERSIRRAGLPFAVTRGFSPHMKVAFGPALPVGTAGKREYLDVWLTRFAPSADALDALQRVTPDDLGPHEAYYVSDAAPSLTAALVIAKYRASVEGRGIESEEVHAALSRLIGGGELAVKHKGKQKVFDLARCVPEDPRVTGRPDGVRIELTVRMGPQGSLRPEALIRAALADIGTEASVVRTTRLDTLVESEEGVWSRPV